MVDKPKKTRRFNIYFRQTAKAFRAAKQTQIFSHIQRNLPFRIYQFSKEKFNRNLQYLKNEFNKVTTKLPKQNNKV